MLVWGVEESGIKLRVFVLGVGYDVMVIVDICFVVMLFICCKGGISYYFVEFIIIDDVVVSLLVFYKIISKFKYM